MLTSGSRYAVTKLIEVFFVRELAARIESSQKSNIIVNCLTPGACRSDFDRESTDLSRMVHQVLARLIGRSTEVGS